MAIDIDGYAVLGAIARQPEAFPAIRNEVSKAARTLVAKQLKEKAVPLSSLRKVADAIDFEAFDIILDLMSDAEIKSLLGKVDKLNAAAKTESAQWQRKHISDLSQGRAEAVVKQTKAKLEKPKATTPVVERAASARFSKAKKKI